MAANMIHSEHGGQMTPEEIGEYVAGCVRKSREEGGFDHFLFVTTAASDGPDVCHVGNGPRGPFNACLIAAAPDLIEAGQRLLAAIKAKRDWPDNDTTKRFDAMLSEFSAAEDAFRAVIAKATSA